MFRRMIQISCFMVANGVCWAGDLVNNPSLSVWTNEAIVSTYTYSYEDFLERQKDIAHYFTSNGWIAYTSALQDSKLIDVVKKNKYVVSSVATLPPEITKVSDGHWVAVMPIVVLYQSGEHKQKQRLEVRINFITAPSGQGVRGYAIESLVSKITKPMCLCKDNNQAMI